MSWLKQNAKAVEAGAAVVTALVAVLALAALKHEQAKPGKVAGRGLDAAAADLDRAHALARDRTAECWFRL